MPLLQVSRPQILRPTYSAGGGGGGGGDTFDFPLPAGNAIPAANLTMRLIHPRPDSDGDINSWERHKLQPAGVPLRIPVGVMGGIPPFRYTISTDMPGLTIGQDLPRDWWDSGLQNHGVLMCDSPSAGTYTTTVTITDQESSTVSTTFDTVVADKNDTTKFRWYDSVGGNNSNSGSYDAPYLDDLRIVFGTTSSTSTFTGQVILKDGSYALVGHTDLTTGNIRLNNATRPVVMYSLPVSGSTAGSVTLSFASARFNALSGGNAEGLFVGEIVHDGETATLTNMQNYYIPDSQDRITFFNISVTGVGVGSSGNDNATFCFFNNGATGTDSTYNHNVFFRGVTESNRPTASNSYGITSAYGLKYFLFEDCRTPGSNADVDVYLKDSDQSGSLRYCSLENSGSTAVGGVGGQNQNGGTTTDIEYVYCRLNASNIANNALVVNAAGLGGVVGTVYTSRCTLKGQWESFNSSTPGGQHYSTNDVVYTSASPPVKAGTNNAITTAGTELHGSTAWINTTTLKLTDTYAAYRGTRGAEIFDT